MSLFNTKINGINVDIHYEVVGSRPNKKIEIKRINLPGSDYKNWLYDIAIENIKKVTREIELKEMLINPFNKEL